MKRSISCFLLSYLAAIPFVEPAGATAIAVVRNSETVVFAADSRESGEKADPKLEACKIRAVGSSVFSAHGFVRNGVTGYDLPRIVEITTSEAKSLEENRKDVAVTVLKDLHKAAADLSRRAPDRFKKYLGESAMAGILLARYEQGIPKLTYITFHAKVTGQNLEVRSKQRTCPGDCASEVASVFVAPFATTDSPAQSCNKDPEGCIRDPALKVRQFVEWAVGRGDPRVGGTINVAALTKTGVKWVQGNEECRIGERASPDAR